MDTRKSKVEDARAKGICFHCKAKVSSYANFCNKCGSNLRTGQTRMELENWHRRHPAKR